MPRFGDPFFLGGLAALLWFFSTALFVGLSLFDRRAAPGAWMRRQGGMFQIQLLVTATLCGLLWSQLQPLTSLPEPTLADIESWMRRATSLLLLGISAVFASLATAFGWVRVGRAGSAFRSVVWAVLALKVVIASLGVMTLLDRARLKGGEDAIPVGQLPEAAEQALSSLPSIATVWLPITLALIIASAWMSWRGSRTDRQA